ncbi:AAA family ATPase [Candidatus Odyssella thessalonicensis]|uniref:AAA family ATPase n=1 Tax=Candidatus Odyssella thessalonicensis TaxID=84647 RepID=UPI000225B92A|nr:AAA family ATPase [Candidatus Odyssella thessalonicensis]
MIKCNTVKYVLSIASSFLILGAAEATDINDKYNDGYSTPPRQHVHNTSVDEDKRRTDIDQRLTSPRQGQSKRKRISKSTEEVPPLKKIKGLDLSGVPFPPEIYEHLIQYTIGQEGAMRSLASFIHRHLVNNRWRKAKPETYKSHTKANVLMIGSTGCGKTSTLKVLADYLKIPFVVGNATEWTAQGYVGDKWQGIFDKLYAQASIFLSQNGSAPSDSDILLAAEQGIVFIDEIDKLCTKSLSTKGQNLSVIERVQQELLPVVQGTTVRLENKKNLDTTNILFIAGGAFPGLLSKKNGEKISLQPLTTMTLEDYGMIPELAGRLGNIVQFSDLSKDDLKRILIESKTSALMEEIDKHRFLYDIELTIADDALDYIATIAALHGSGARALNTMLSKVLEGFTFNIKDYMGHSLIIEKEIAVTALKDQEHKKEPEDISHLFMYT